MKAVVIRSKLFLRESRRALDRNQNIFCCHFSLDKLKNVSWDKKTDRDLFQVKNKFRQQYHIAIEKRREPVLYSVLKEAPREIIYEYLYNTLMNWVLGREEKEKYFNKDGTEKIQTYIHPLTGLKVSFPLIKTLNPPYSWDIREKNFSDPSKEYDEKRSYDLKMFSSLNGSYYFYSSLIEPLNLKSHELEFIDI